MWLQRITNFILRNRWQALALTFLMTFVPVLGILGILIAAFITLRKGIAEGALFTVAATLPFVISGMTGHHEGTLPVLVWAAVGVAVLSNLLTWLFAVMLRRQFTWSQMLQAAALLGVLAISVVHLYYPDVADWWGAQLMQMQQYVNQTLVTAGVVSNAALTEDQLREIAANKLVASGVLVSAILVNAILQLIVARWWQAAVFAPGMLRKELHSIRMSSLAGFLFIASIVMAYLGNSVVLDIMPILYILFSAAGLSVMHYYFGLMRPPAGFLWIVVFYSVLFFAAVLGAVSVIVVIVQMLALLGVVDVWLNVRKRLKAV